MALQELHAVLEGIEYGILFMDSDLRVRMCNRAYREIWGIPEDFYAAKPTLIAGMEFTRDRGLYDLGDQSWKEFVEDRLAPIRAGDGVPRELKLSNGRIVQFRCIALPDGGRMLTYYDITELKRREEEVAEKSAILEATLENMAQGISMTDAGLRLIAFNRRFLEILGLPPGRIHDGGGDISDTAGDGLMVIFQDLDGNGSAMLAVDTALRLFEATEALNAANEVEPLGVHMGINSGPALVGSTRIEGARGSRWIFTATAAR